MKLTAYTDYSIRVLVYIGINNDQLCTASEISEFYGLSRNHLSKIIHHLSSLEIIQSYKGPKGGIELAKDPKEINLGNLIRKTEPDFHIVECFASNINCRIAPACKLKSILYESNQLFLKNLDRYSLADVLKNRKELLKLVGTPF
tara:strand:- start:706 stop:1140 length:435 start_codon:yes stop_codon:yes gene_type:complete